VLLVLLLLSFVALTGGVSLAAEWVSLGPYGGKAIWLVATPGDPDVVYVFGEPDWFRGEVNGLLCHKSTDGGRTWGPMDIPGAFEFDGVALNPRQPSILYTASRTGLYKTTDAGATWRQVHVNHMSLTAVAVDQAQHVLIATRTKLFRSTDGEQSWQELTVPVPEMDQIAHILCDPQDPACFYVRGLYFLLRTTDGGLNWQEIRIREHGGVRSLTIDPRNSSVLYAGTQDYKLARSTDRGTTWTILPAEGQIASQAIALDPQNPERICVGTGIGPGVQVSDDGGTTWSEPDAGWVPRALNVRSIVVLPGTPTRILAGSYGAGIYASEDSGRSWTEANDGLPGRADVQEIKVHPADPSIWYASTQHGVYRSTDSGRSWRASNRGITSEPFTTASAVAISPVRPEIVYAGLGHGRFKSTNAGETWQRLDRIPDHNHVFAIDPSKPNIIYSGTTGGVMKSTDAGLNWDKTPSSQGEVKRMVLDPFDPETIYAGNQKSADGGQTWTQFPLTYVEALAACSFEPGTVYVGWKGSDVPPNIYSGGFRKTTNGGATWVDVAIPDPKVDVSAVAVHPTRRHVVYAATRYGLLISKDAGTTWTRVEVSRPIAGIVQSLLVDPVDPDRLIAGTSFGGIFEMRFTPPANPELNVVWPNGRERLVAGGRFTIRWIGKGAGPNVKLEYSSNGGASWSLITASTENDGAYEWEAPAAPGSGYVVRVSQLSGGLADVSDRPFSIAACDYAVEARPLTFDYYVFMDASISITSLSSGQTCGWVAQTDAPWISFASPTSGESDGTVRFRVADNEGGARTATILVAGKSITVTQAPAPCFSSLVPGQMKVAPDGGMNQVGVHTGPHCAWAAATDVPWIQFSGASSGVGPGPLSFNVLQNTSDSKRSAQLNVGGAYLIITQESMPAGTSLHEYRIPYFKIGTDQTEGQYYTTGVAYSNPTDLDSWVSFKAYDTEGGNLQVPVNPSVRSVIPREPQADELYRIFSDRSERQREAWLEMKSLQPVSNFYMMGNPDQMDGSVSFTRQAKRLYFTRVFQGETAFRGQAATTKISLVNPNETPIELTLRLFRHSPPGPARQVSAALGAKAMLLGSVDQLFDVTEVRDGYIIIEVTEGAGAIGSEVIQFPAMKTLVVLNASVPDDGLELYSAQLATIPGIFTDIRLLNTSSDSRRLVLEAVADDGTMLASAVTFDLGPGESIQEDAAELFGPTPRGFVGTLRVSADGHGITGDVIFGDPQLLFASALGLQAEPFTHAVFGHIAHGYSAGDYVITGFALHNPSNQPATVRLEVVGAFQPSEMLTTEFQIGPGCRTAKLINELIPGLHGGLVLFGGYVRVRSSQPLIAQELFRNSTFLAAVPPTVWE
jgi:photosystem II stability/assembly factor-like uncharacterized protein